MNLSRELSRECLGMPIHKKKTKTTPKQGKKPPKNLENLQPIDSFFVSGRQARYKRYERRSQQQDDMAEEGGGVGVHTAAAQPEPDPFAELKSLKSTDPDTNLLLRAMVNMIPLKAGFDVS